MIISPKSSSQSVADPPQIVRSSQDFSLVVISVYQSHLIPYKHFTCFQTSQFVDLLPLLKLFKLDKKDLSLDIKAKDIKQE